MWDSGLFSFSLNEFNATIADLKHHESDELSLNEPRKLEHYVKDPFVLFILKGGTSTFGSLQRQQQVWDVGA